jgi:gliding motility-associated-like protein
LSATSGDTITASNIVTGVYTYYATATLNGCSSVDSVKVTVLNSFTATAGPPVTICFGQSAPLSVTGGSSWNWTPSGTSCDTCPQTTATPSVSTIYTVVAASGACTDTVTESVTVIPNASASFNTAVLNQGIPQTVQFNNASGNASGYYWTFGNDNATSVLQNPAYTYNAEGTYTVELIAYGTNGCNDTISTVLLITDTVGIFVPNIFTPNGDEINDVWKPSVHGATSLECTIYNRWGIKVYEFANTQDHWDGYTTGGLPCQDGTYYYILKATDRNNKNYDFKGYLQLIH